LKKRVIVENNCKGGDPKIYENSIFPAYVPEKNKIITPCVNFKIIKFHLLSFQNIFKEFFSSIFQIRILVFITALKKLSS